MEMQSDFKLILEIYLNIKAVILGPAVFREYQ